MIILQGWACSLRVSARNAAKTLPDRHTEILARDADVTVGKNLQHGSIGKLSATRSPR
jgi:hypothetical protein